MHLQKTKKAIAILCLGAILATTSGCAANTGSSTGGASALSAENSKSSDAAPPVENENIGGLSLPIANGDVTIKIMRSDSASEYGGSLNTDTYPVVEEIKKRTGINIVFEAIANNAYSDTLNTRLASGGKELPDVFIMGGGDLMKLGSDGIIADLAPYLKDENAPNFLKYLDENPQIKGVLTAPNGAVYGLPNRISPKDAEVSCLMLGYRADWTQKVGLGAPDTIEDWYTMLTKFKNDDPNGNGQADEIPLIAWSPNQIYDFALAYGLSPWSNFFSAINGKIHYDWTSDVNSPKAKAYIEEMRKWFAEGLIDQDMNTEHEDKATAMLLGNQVGAEQRWTGTLLSYNETMKNDVPGVKWALAMPPKGPFGDRAYENYPAMNNERWIITSNNKNIEATLKFFDFVFATEEGSMLNNCGMEGDSYVLEDGKATFTDAVLKSEYERPDIALWVKYGCGLFPVVINDTYTYEIMGSSMTDDDRKVMADASQYFRTMFPTVMALKEESDVIASRLTDIETYMMEMVFGFIMGNFPMEKWDEFVSKLKSMGIDEVLQVKQAQYDRYVAAGK